MSLSSLSRLLSHLMESHEEAVDVVPGAAGVKRVLVLFDLFHRKLSHFVNFTEQFAVSPRQPFHHPGEQVVHL